MITAATRNAELARTLHQLIYETKHPVNLAILGNAVARGEVPADTSAGPAARGPSRDGLDQEAVGAGPLDEDFVVHAVDDVLLPVLPKGV